MHARIRRAQKPQARERRQSELAELDRQIDELKATRSSLPTHVRAADLPEDEALHSLPVGQRLLLGIVRMIAYRAETRMMQPLITGPGKGRSTSCSVPCSHPTPTSSRNPRTASSASDSSASEAMPASEVSIPSSKNSTKSVPNTRGQT